MNIIYLDDEANMRDVMTSFLEMYNHNVTTYTDPSFLKSHKQHFDVLITDGQMIGYDYRDSYRIMRELGHHKKPIIVYTGNKDIFDIVVSINGLAVFKDGKVKSIVDIINSLEHIK